MTHNQSTNEYEMLFIIRDLACVFEQITKNETFTAIRRVAEGALQSK